MICDMCGKEIEYDEGEYNDVNSITCYECLNEEDEE